MAAFQVTTSGRIWLTTGGDGLYGLVRERLECDSINGHLYLFANSRCDRMKILFFDDASLWVCAPHGTLPIALAGGRGRQGAVEQQGVCAAAW